MRRTDLIAALREARNELVGLSCYLSTCDPVVIVDNLETTAKKAGVAAAKIEAVLKAEGVAP